MEKDIKNIVDRIIEQKGKTVNAVIPVLQAIQNHFNYLPKEALEGVCSTTGITPSRIYGISTFYTQFRHKPVGQHIIRVCVGTACHVKGSLLVYDSFKRNLNIKGNEETDEKGLFTIEKVACLGCCTIAPVVQIGNITYGHVTPESVPEVIDDFLNVKNGHKTIYSPVANPNSVQQGEIRIGLGSCCVASGSAGVKDELEKTLSRNGINVTVKHVGCVGICNQVPLLEVNKPGETPTFYTKIKPDEVKEVVLRHFKPDSFINQIRSRFINFFEAIAFENIPKTLNRYPADKRETPVAEFLENQINIATEHRGIIKPTDIDEYIRLGGFQGLKQCLKLMTPQQVIDLIKESGLRGRGGAGFPTGTKWQLVANELSDKKYIICNGDEGDPGAFMDRMLLESYPFRVIEGIIIAAYAVGATEGLFYIRAEYPLALQRIREALTICYNKGFIGEKILGTNFSFSINIFEGAGAFVCGEETALMASVEGNRGYPNIRPPYPAQKGLWGKPTLINNVETYSLVSWIIRNGSEAFHNIGTKHSKGTKVFALAGKINRGGLIEVPMGITIRKIVEEIGGGIPNRKKFKAVQIGGPSGGCIPESLADTPIDYHSLVLAGAMMGSGGLIVLDETDCMVDIARYFLSFTQDQSCGRCTFCRIGTRRMLEILNKISSGKGKPEDLDSLQQLAELIKKGSICGLGKSAPNPVLTTLKYFRDEYIAHINGKCPTGKCKEMITYDITDECIGCTKCAQRCPSGAILAKPYELHHIDTEKCIKCDICKQVCPVNAVITK